MEKPPLSSEQNRSAEPADLSGVTISGQANVTAHDIIGRDKIIHGDEYIGYTAAQVTVLLDKIRAEYQSKPFDGRSPYVGLASFQERDADKFFGRETLTAELVTRVAASAASNARALFVAGPSGSGKSSLVRAGLIPALRGGVLLNAPTTIAGSEHWLYETFKPGRAPLDELARVVSSFANSPDAGDDFRAHALKDATRLHRWADIALKEDAARRAVLVIDQFEEIFTQLAPEREAERVAFLQQLTHAATIENGRVLVIFTLRSDFVSNCASYPNLNALVNQQFIQVGAMTPDELVSAIARPAYQVGLRIDPALISQIVNDVRGEPGALPLMQFALQDLFEHEKQKGELTLDGYTARGGLHEALERHADAEFAKLDDAEKELARSVFGGLIEIGRGREDTKRTARFGELVPAGADAERVQALVRELADARLITTDEQDGKETVTLAHERLIDAWDWLRKLVDENRDAIALQNEIAQDAQEWETQHRDESYLYRGARLATAQEKLQDKQLVLSGLAQEFVETAIKAREEAKRKEARQTRRLIIAFGAAAVVLAGFAIGALLLWQRAELQQRIARSRELATVAISQLNVDPERALLIAINANEIFHTSESEDSLRQALLVAPIFLIGHTSALNEANFSPDGSKIVTTSWDGTARIWDATTGKELTRLRHTTVVRSVNFSPDGTKIVTTSSDGTTRVWDVTTGKELTRIQGYGFVVESANFSPGGNKIVTASFDKTARVWDAQTGKQLVELLGHTDIVLSARFSPDGGKIVTASADKTARVWDAQTGREVTQNAEHRSVVRNAMFSSDGRKIITEGNGTLQAWDAITGMEVTLAKKDFDIIRRENRAPDGSKFASIAQSDVWIMHLPLAPGKPPTKLQGHNDVVSSANFSPDGTQIVTASYDNTARVWDAATGKELAVLRGHEGVVTSARFSPDGSRIVTASADGTARVFLVKAQDLADLAKRRVGRELTCEERVQFLRQEIVCPTPTPTPTP